MEAPFWNVLVLYGHCPNCFRPPPLLSNGQTWRKSTPNHPGKPLHPPPYGQCPYGNNTFQKGASLTFIKLLKGKTNVLGRGFVGEASKMCQDCFLFAWQLYGSPIDEQRCTKLYIKYKFVKQVKQFIWVNNRLKIIIIPPNACVSIENGNQVETAVYNESSINPPPSPLANHSHIH